MRSPVLAFACLLATLSLTGCFTSQEPLIADSQAAAPYEKITFQAENDSEITVGQREGSAYVLQGQETEIALRFLDTGDDIYVVEVTGVDEGTILRLYGTLKIDFSSGTASAYKIFAASQEIGPGFRACENETVCIDDLDAYVALAKAEIASGADPAAVYAITVE